MKEFEKHILQMAIDDNDRHFREYLHLIKTTVDIKNQNLESQQETIEKGLEGKNEEYKEYEYEHLADLAYELEQLEQMLYRSFVVSVFMFMEDLSSKLCGHIKKQRNQAFSHTDLKGNGVGRSVEYLKKVLGHDFPKNLAVKERFVVAREIRNSVVHADGKIKKDKRKIIEDYIRKNSTHLTMTAYGEIIINYEYIESLLKLNTEFSDEISKNWLVAFPL